MTAPGGAGSQGAGDGNTWREIHRLNRELEQVRGQLAAAKAKLAGTVTHVARSGSSLLVTYGDGHTETI